jgi:hypothetical protein
VGTVFLLHPPIGVGLSVLTPRSGTNHRHGLTIWQEGRDQGPEAIEAANQPAKSEEQVVLAPLPVSVAGGSHGSQHAACDRQAARWARCRNERTVTTHSASHGTERPRRDFRLVSGLSRGVSRVRRSKGSALGPCDGGGSQVGSHSLWTRPDTHGRRWTRQPIAAGSADPCGHPWTPLGDLWIRRLGAEHTELAESPPSVPMRPC